MTAGIVESAEMREWLEVNRRFRQAHVDRAERPWDANTWVALDRAERELAKAHAELGT